MKIYFTNAQTGKRYEVVAWDKETNKVTLSNDGATFVEEYSKERFKRLGYKLEKVENEDA